MKSYPLTTNRASLYAPVSDHYIRGISPVPGGVVIHLHPNGEIPFIFNGEEKTIWEDIGTHHIECSHIPARHYMENGQASHGWVTLKSTDIPFMPAIDPGVWRPKMPKDQAEAVHKELGSMKPLDEFAILAHIHEELKDHKGTPSDAMMAMPPLEQYRAAMRGEGRIWCSNIVDIMVLFCRAYGIPARRINLWQGGLMDAERTRAAGFNIQTAEGHTTMEVYNDCIGSWVWMDPMFGVYGAHLGGIILTLNGLACLVNNPMKEFHITLDVVGGTKSIRFPDWSGAAQFRNYLNPTQVISYIADGEE